MQLLKIIFCTTFKNFKSTIYATKGVAREGRNTTSNPPSQKEKKNDWKDKWVLCNLLIKDIRHFH